jgi:hypothetical protein
MFLQNFGINIKYHTASRVGRGCGLLPQPTYVVPEDGGSVFLRNFGIYSQYYTALQLIRRQFGRTYA